MDSLQKTFAEIRLNHRGNILRRAARVTLGSSVMRVFKKDTKKDLLDALLGVPVDDVRGIRDEATFTAWFEQQLDKIADAILAKNPTTKNWSAIHPGYKWGHAAKILCLYLREVVECSRYFSQERVDRIREWLFVPIDGLVIKQLKKDGQNVPFGQIKDIERRNIFMDVQAGLGNDARNAKAPRIWYDDAWLNRD